MMCRYSHLLPNHWVFTSLTYTITEKAQVIKEPSSGASLSIPILGHGVIARTAPRITAQYALDTQPCTFEYAIFHHCFHHILAASRRISARRRRERRDTIAVEIARQQKYLTDKTLHYQSLMFLTTPRAMLRVYSRRVSLAFGLLSR